MQKDALVEVLREAGATKGKDGWFRFEGRQGVTLLVSAGAGLITIDRVIRVSVRDSFVVAESERAERFFVDPERVAAVRQPCRVSDGTGFLNATP